MKPFDKDALVAKIKRMIDKAFPNSEWNHGYVTACESIISLINTIEIKEMDLDKEFDKCSENYIFDDECEMYTAKHFFKLGIKVMKEE